MRSPNASIVVIGSAGRSPVALLVLLVGVVIVLVIPFVTYHDDIVLVFVVVVVLVIVAVASVSRQVGRLGRKVRICYDGGQPQLLLQIVHVDVEDVWPMRVFLCVVNVRIEQASQV